MIAAFLVIVDISCQYVDIMQVLALDKRFLDPRRTLNPTQAEKEEGIIPLTDTLPIMPQVSFLFKLATKEKHITFC